MTEVLEPWSTGGRESRLSGLLPSLAIRGVDVTVFTMRWWKVPPIDQSLGEGHIRIRSVSPRLKLYRNARRSFVQPFIFALGTLRLLSADFDVIETDVAPLIHIPFVWIVSKIRRRPLVITWYEVWDYNYWKEFAGRLGLIGSLAERVTVHLGTVVVATSRRTHRQLQERGVSKNRLFSAESIVPILPESIQSDSPELLFIGRLTGHKRPDIAISVLKYLSDLDLRLAIVGSGTLRKQLEVQVQTLGLENRVLFLEWVTDEELGALIKSARILLSPSEREGFGIVVAQALRVGTPVVTVDARTNAASDLVVDGISGRICPAGDVSAISLAVRSLIENPLSETQVKSSWESLSLNSNFGEVADILVPLYQSIKSR